MVFGLALPGDVHSPWHPLSVGIYANLLFPIIILFIIGPKSILIINFPIPHVKANSAGALGRLYLGLGTSKTSFDLFFFYGQGVSGAIQRKK